VCEGQAGAHQFGQSEVAARRRLDKADRFGGELHALQKRWENRFSSKDFHVIGEAYAEGRLSLVCEFEVAPGILIADRVHNAPGSDAQRHVLEHIIVHLINKAHAADFGHRDAGDDQVVLIDVVGLPDLPEAKIPSLVRFYDGKQIEREKGKSFHYSSARWGGLSRFGRFEGVTQRLPAILGWEVYAGRIAGLGLHEAGHDIFEGGAEAMEAVANREKQMRLNGLCPEADRLFAGFRVSIINQFVEVAFGELTKDRLRLLKVSVGPIDL